MITKHPKLLKWSLMVSISLFLSIALGYYVYTKDHGNPKPPLILPLSLEKAGTKLETNIEIVDRNIYYFSLRFSFKEGDEDGRARVKTLMGGAGRDKLGNALQSGVPTPLILRINAVENDQVSEIYVKEIDPILGSWGGDHFDKLIGYTELKPGFYKIELDNLRSCPEFNEIPVALGIGYDKYKQSFTPKEK